MNDNVIRKSSYLEKWDIQKIMERAEEENNKMILENLENVEEEFVANIFGNNKLNQALDFINNKVYSDRYERNEVKAEYIRDHYDETKEEFMKAFNEKISQDEDLEIDFDIEEVGDDSDYEFIVHNHDYDVDRVNSFDFDEDGGRLIFALMNDDYGVLEEYISTMEDFKKAAEENNLYDVSKCMIVYENDIIDIITGETESVGSLVDFCISELT